MLTQWKRIVWGGVLGLLLSLLVLSALLESTIDRSLVTQMPCAPPCWQGIVPGHTGTSEAMKILLSSRYVAFDDVYLRTAKLTGTEPSEVEVARWRSVKNIIAFLLFDSQNVSLLTFRGHVVENIIVKLDYRLRLDEFIQQYGEPERLVCEGHTVTLLYPHQGLAVVVRIKWHREEKEYIATLEADSLVITALYFVPSSLTELLQHPPTQVWLGGTDNESEVLRNWEGYAQEIWRVPGQ